MKACLFFAFILLHCMSTAQPLIIAHRGASGKYPENTLIAVEKALEIGVDLVEVDVHLSKDGRVVVIHDETLDRTSKVNGYVEDYSWKELKGIDVGSWMDDKFSEQRIPLLEDVIQKCIGQAKVLIEIKKGRDYYNEIEEKCWKIVQDLKAQDWVEFQSFYDHSLKAMQKAGISVKCHKLLVGAYPGLPFYIDHKFQMGNFFKKSGLNYTGMNPNENFITATFLNKAHSEDHLTYVWTVNDEKKMRKLIQMNVDGIITNYPLELKHIINE